MRTESTQRGKVAIRADVDRELAEQLRAAAARDHRTVAGYVRHMVKKSLDAAEERRDG